MKYLKSSLGYLAAFLSILLSIATLTDDGIIGKLIVKHGNLVVSPNMNGGSIINTLHRDGFRVVIHEPVFLGLFRPPKKGFIQIDIFRDSHAPALISEGIDFNGDKKIDFTIVYNSQTNHAEIQSYNSNVSTRFTWNKRKSAYTVRIALTHAVNGMVDQKG